MTDQEYRKTPKYKAYAQSYYRVYNQLPHNKEKARIIHQKYRQSLKGRLAIKTRGDNRRLKNKELTLVVIQLVYEDNIKKYGTLTCYLCLKPIKFGNDHLEHKTPLSRGGNSLYDNLGVSCAHCNKVKHNQTVEEFSNRDTKS